MGQRLPSFGPQHVSNVLWGLATLGHQPGPQLLDELASHATDLFCFDSQQVQPGAAGAGGAVSSVWGSGVMEHKGRLAGTGAPWQLGTAGPHLDWRGCLPQGISAVFARCSQLILQGSSAVKLEQGLGLLLWPDAATQRLCMCLPSPPQPPLKAVLSHACSRCAGSGKAPQTRRLWRLTLLLCPTAKHCNGLSLLQECQAGSVGELQAQTRQACLRPA